MPDTPISLYTDGACIRNPGPGGYGVILDTGGRRKELSAGYRLTTNNRMEIMAVIVGLQALRFPCRVTVYSDSQYVVDTMSKGWAARWRANSWRRSDNKPAINADLWEQMLQLCEQHKVTFAWIRGHAGHPENERCDRLSVAAASGGNLLEDVGYRVGSVSQTAHVGQAQEQLLFIDHVPSVGAVSPLLSEPFIGKPDNRAISIRTDDAWLYVLFRDRRELRVPLAWFPGLHAAQAAQRENYSVDDDGHRLRFPELDLEIGLAQVLGVTEEH